MWVPYLGGEYFGYQRLDEGGNQTPLGDASPVRQKGQKEENVLMHPKCPPRPGVLCECIHPSLPTHTIATSQVKAEGVAGRANSGARDYEVSPAPGGDHLI